MTHSIPTPVSEKVIDSFWSRVDCSGGPNACWEWQGPRNRKGYGTISFCRFGAYLAHRFAWKIAIGEDAGPFKVCHRCDNRSCCNPLHLFRGTQKQNMEDCVAKGRKERGECVAKAKLTAGQVIIIRQMYASYVPLPEIAATFSITPSTARDVSRGKTWKHVPGAAPSRSLPFGEKNARAKLTDKQTSEIREIFAHGGVSQADLAKQFDVSFQLVHLIVRNKVRKEAA